jgi:hypothetical protein
MLKLRYKVCWGAGVRARASHNEAVLLMHTKVFAHHTILRKLYAIVATAPRVTLIFVALIVNNVSCNKEFFFHGLPTTLLQLFSFSPFSRHLAPTSLA